MAGRSAAVTRCTGAGSTARVLLVRGQSSIYSDLLKLSRWAGRSTSTAGRHRVAVQAGLSPNPGRLSRWLGQIVIGGFGLFTSFFDELLVDEFAFLLEGPLVVFLVVGTFGFVLLLGVTPKVRQQRSKYSHTPLEQDAEPHSDQVAASKIFYGRRFGHVDRHRWRSTRGCRATCLPRRTEARARGDNDPWGLSCRSRAPTGRQRAVISNRAHKNSKPCCRLSKPPTDLHPKRHGMSRATRPLAASVACDGPCGSANGRWMTTAVED